MPGYGGGDPSGDDPGGQHGTGSGGGNGGGRGDLGAALGRAAAAGKGADVGGMLGDTGLAEGLAGIGTGAGGDGGFVSDLKSFLSGLFSPQVGEGYTVESALALDDPAMLDRAIAAAALAGTGLTESEALGLTGGISGADLGGAEGVADLAQRTLSELGIFDRYGYIRDYMDKQMPAAVRAAIAASPFSAPYSATSNLTAVIGAALGQMPSAGAGMVSDAPGGDATGATGQQTDPINRLLSDLLNKNQPTQVSNVLGGALGSAAPATARAGFRPLQQRQIHRTVPGALLLGGR